MNFIKYFFIFLLLFLLFGCISYKKNEKIDYIKITDFKDNQKTFFGIVKAQNSADLSFQSEGKIIYLPFTKGDFIKKGQIIAKLDDVLYEIKKNEEEAKLKEYKIQEEKQKRYFNRLDFLHKEGAISDNDWENTSYELQTIKQKINIQKEKIKYIEKEINYTTITAPFDGFISEKFSDVNSYAKIAQPIVRLIDSNGFQVEIIVDENLVNNLRWENEVEIEILNEKLKGKIAHISKSSLNSGGYLIKINIQNTKNILEGMSAKVSLNSSKNSIFIPFDSVFRENEAYFIYKIEKNIIVKSKVSTGEIKDNKIEIFKGIKNEDLIIANPKKVKEGQKIEL